MSTRSMPRSSSRSGSIRARARSKHQGWQRESDSEPTASTGSTGAPVGGGTWEEKSRQEGNSQPSAGQTDVSAAREPKAI